MNKLILLSEKNMNKIIEYIPSVKEIEKFADFFQNFSDGTRLNILSCLSMSDMCVNDLSVVLKVNQTTISHQLRLLKDQNMVSCRREGKILLYSLSSDILNELMLIALKGTA